jgi:hypothetical protein
MVKKVMNVDMPWKNLVMMRELWSITNSLLKKASGSGFLEVSFSSFLLTNVKQAKAQDWVLPEFSCDRKSKEEKSILKITMTPAIS